MKAIKPTKVVRTVLEAIKTTIIISSEDENIKQQLKLCQQNNETKETIQKKSMRNLKLRKQLSKNKIK